MLKLKEALEVPEVDAAEKGMLKLAFAGTLEACDPTEVVLLEELNENPPPLLPNDPKAALDNVGWEAAGKAGAADVCPCGATPKAGAAVDCPCGATPKAGAAVDCPCGATPKAGAAVDCPCGVVAAPNEVPNPPALEAPKPVLLLLLLLAAEPSMKPPLDAPPKAGAGMGKRTMSELP